MTINISSSDYVCVDTGNSGTKAVYFSQKTNKLESLFMTSALDEVSYERVDYQLQQSNWIGTAQPEKQAWIKEGNQAIVIGDFADKFSPEERRQNPKYENALYKILAVIGAIIEAESHSRRSIFKVKLGLLLPWAEYQDRSRLIGRLKEKAKEYVFRGQRVRVKIEDCVCYPEGGGIATARVLSKGKSWFKRQRLGVLMLGDRNWTGLCFESGQIKYGESPLEGFSFLLDQVIKDAPCLLKRDKLSKAIYQGIVEAKTKDCSYMDRPEWGKLEAIQSLATAKDQVFREGEIKDIDKAIRIVGTEWESKLERFLARVFPERLTELNVCGGALPFFKPFIEEYFNCSLDGSPEGFAPKNRAKPCTPLLEAGGIINQVKEELEFKTLIAMESAYSVRFADVFALMKSLLKKDSLAKKQKVVGVSN